MHNDNGKQLILLGILVLTAGTLSAQEATMPILQIKKEKNIQEPISTNTNANPVISSNAQPIIAEQPLNNDELVAMELLIEKLNNSLASASIKLQRLKPKPNMGKLRDIERKAFAYDALNIRVAQKDKTIALLQEEINSAVTVIAKQKDQITSLTNALAQTTTRTTNLANDQDSMKEALKLIQLGQYEYYEIKEGDTCESIAAQSTIYNDVTKNVLIRQANKGNVLDLDKLVTGEMLIIPRFSVTESYEF